MSDVKQFLNVEAGADYSDSLGAGVQVEATDPGSIGHDVSAIVPTGDGEMCHGVITEPGGASGDSITIHLFSAGGVEHVLCGGSVSKGDELMVETGGGFVTATTDGVVHAIALQAGEDGDLIRAIIGYFGLA